MRKYLALTDKGSLIFLTDNSYQYTAVTGQSLNSLIIITNQQSCNLLITIGSL